MHKDEDTHLAQRRGHAPNDWRDRANPRKADSRVGWIPHTLHRAVSTATRTARRTLVCRYSSGKDEDTHLTSGASVVVEPQRLAASKRRGHAPNARRHRGSRAAASQRRGHSPNDQRIRGSRTAASGKDEDTHLTTSANAVVELRRLAASVAHDISAKTRTRI